VEDEPLPPQPTENTKASTTIGAARALTGAVVPTVTVTVCVPLPLICTDWLDRPHVEAGVTAGVIAQFRLTVPAIALQVNAYLLVINTEHYCVMVIVRAAVWLFAPVPLVDAVRVTVLDPAGVPEFAGLLLLPHEARLTVNNARAQML